MRIIYAGKRLCASAQEAAREVSRLSGEDVETWQINHALLGRKGFVHGIPVRSPDRPWEEPEQPLRQAAPAGPKAGEPGGAPRKPALVRMGDWYDGGLPPRWR
jgi:hypothetical protein